LRSCSEQNYLKNRWKYNPRKYSTVVPKSIQRVYTKFLLNHVPEKSQWHNKIPKHNKIAYPIYHCHTHNWIYYTFDSWFELRFIGATLTNIKCMMYKLYTKIVLYTYNIRMYFWVKNTFSYLPITLNWLTFFGSL